MSSEDDNQEGPLFEELDECCSIADSEIILFDATTSSTLKWPEALVQLEALKQSQKKCLVHLDLGLFSHLHKPLTDKAQFLSISLAINHFVETVYTKYQDEIQGVILFAGDLLEQIDDTEPPSLWDFLDARFEFLHLVSNMLPRSATPICILEATHIRSYTVYCTLLVKAQQNGITLHTRHAPFTIESIETTLAICFNPDHAKEIEITLNTAITSLLSKNISFKIVSEESITTEWSGIDKLLVTSPQIDPMTKRKLQGFAAALGQIIYLSEPTGIEDELSFQQWT